MKRTLYLLVAAAAVTATVIAVAPFAAAHPAAKQKTTTIRSSAKEYKFILSKKSAPAGKVIVQGREQGQDQPRLPDRRQEDDQHQARQVGQAARR